MLADRPSSFDWRKTSSQGGSLNRRLSPVPVPRSKPQGARLYGVSFSAARFRPWPARAHGAGPPVI
jgi:hypothetical protein